MQSRIDDQYEFSHRNIELNYKVKTNKPIFRTLETSKNPKSNATRTNDRIKNVTHTDR